MSLPLKSRHFARLLPFVKASLILLPVVLIAWLLKTHLLNVPFMDDHVWLPFYEKIARHEFSFRDFFFVQMEHRLTVPCFVAWLAYHLKPGQITLHNWLSFIQLAVTTFNLGWLIRRTCGSPRWHWLLMALTAWIVFSPTQSYTFLWSDCFSSFLPATFLTTALVVFYSSLRSRWKFVLCVVCAVLSSHSYASGILIWFLMVPLILWSDSIADGIVRRRFLVGWSIFFVVTMALYFHGLTNQAEPEFSYKQGHEETLTKHIGAFVGDPVSSARFVLIFGGALLARGSFADIKDASEFLGILLGLVVLLAMGLVLRPLKSHLLRSRFLPWIVLGIYSFGTGAMVALGRIWASASLDGALWNRYTTHAVPLTVAVVVLVFLIIQEMERRFPDWHNALLATRTGLLGAFIMILTFGWIYGLAQADAWWSSRLRDATCNLFARVLPPDDIEGPITGNLKFARRMDDLGLLHPPMLRDCRLSNFRVSDKKISARTGRVDAVEPVGHGKFEAEGFAFLPGHERVADGIFLTYLNDKKEWMIFSVGQVKELPKYLNKVIEVDMQYLHQPYRSFRHVYGAFNTRFNLENIPAGRWEMGVWAFDFKKRCAWRLPGRYRIETQTHRIVEFGNEATPAAGE